MSITLYRFPISHFSEKARLFLDYKELDYEVVDLKLGLPQLRIVRMTGQRQLPVIDHDGRVVHDSTEIGLYLDRAFPEHRPLLPKDDALRREVLALEDRIDNAFGLAAPMVWLRKEAYTPEVVPMLEIEVAGMGKLGARGLAAMIRASEKGPLRKVFDRAEERVRAILSELSSRLEGSRYLVGDEPTLADFAAAGLALHLKYPSSRRLPFPELAGRGVPGLVDDPKLARFFDWRDRLYADYSK